MGKAPYTTRRLHFETRTFSRLAAVALFASTVWMAPRTQARGLPVQEGILNYGKVSERLYRGAQPDAEGIKGGGRWLKQAVFNTPISL